jgi:beta-lactam-binding protein with PASTA domain
VSVPNLIGKSETDAFNLLAAAKLQLGTKTEAFDATVPAGFVVSQHPEPGVVVNEQTPIAYVLSKGPEPSPSPSPSPTPTPTATPTPTPPPTPPPTLPPSPRKVTVADYRCITLAEATADIEGDHLVVGTVTTHPDSTATPGPDWIVTGQSPNPGQKVASGSAIDLDVWDPSVAIPTCPL